MKDRKKMIIIAVVICCSGIYFLLDKKIHGEHFGEVEWMNVCSKYMADEAQKPFTFNASDIPYIEEVSQISDNKVMELKQNLLAFYLVLNNKKPFISADEGCQEFYWDEYYWHQGELVLSFTISGFMLVDMDGDEKTEIVLTCYPDTVLILHDAGEGVRGYRFSIYDEMRTGNGISDRIRYHFFSEEKNFSRILGGCEDEW